MKKQILSFVALIILCVSGSVSFAQSHFYKNAYKFRNSGAYDKETALLSVAYGVLDFQHGFKEKDFKADGNLGPFYAQLEKAVMDELGIGFKMAAGFTYGDYHGLNHFNTTNLALGVHAIYHFNKFIPWEFLDVYAGAGAGVRYNILTFERNIVEDGKDEIKVFPEAFVGVRYYFIPQLGVFVQGGYDGFSSLQAGLTFRLYSNN